MGPPLWRLAGVCGSWYSTYCFLGWCYHGTDCFLDRAVEEGLTYKFHAAWSSVLQLLAVFFEACGKQAHPVMKKVRWELLGQGTGGSWLLARKNRSIL